MKKQDKTKPLIEIENYLNKNEKRKKETYLKEIIESINSHNKK